MWTFSASYSFGNLGNVKKFTALVGIFRNIPTSQKFSKIVVNGLNWAARLRND